MLNIIKLKNKLAQIKCRNNNISLIFKNHMSSTNNYLAYKYIKDMCPVVISTYSQRSARGRKNKIWTSFNNQSLSFSLCLKIDTKIFDLRSLSYLACVALYESIKSQDNRNFKIKWPNDIYLNNKKVSGILIESYSISKQVYSSIGIGINLNLEAKNTNYSYTNLRDNVDEEKLITYFCKRFFNSISENVNHEIIRIFNDNLYGYLSKVEITSELEKNKGKLLGINEKGQLMLKSNNTITYIDNIGCTLRLL